MSKTILTEEAVAKACYRVDPEKSKPDYKGPRQLTLCSCCGEEPTITAKYSLFPVGAWSVSIQCDSRDWNEDCEPPAEGSCIAEAARKWNQMHPEETPGQDDNYCTCDLAVLEAGFGELCKHNPSGSPDV